MKWIRYFILSAGTILLIAALSRSLIAFGNAQVLLLPELVMGIRLRFAVLMVAVAEFAVALFCLFGKRSGLQAGCVTGLGFHYMAYHFGAVLIGGHYGTTAVGSLTDPLQLTRGFSGVIVGLAPLCLVVGGAASCVWLWLRDGASDRRKAAENSIKMTCPGCGVHIRFDRARIGQHIDCPQCQRSVSLCQREIYKMSCFFCHGHIEFPNYAIGEKLKCPHCKNSITLKESA